MNDTEPQNTCDEELARDLKALKAEQPGAPAYLEQRIMANLPDREPTLELLDWLRASAWRSVTAAALPLIFGFVMGVLIGGDEVSYTDSILYADIWEAYESNEI